MLMNMREYLEQLYNQSLQLCKTIDDLTHLIHLEDSQEFLNWHDSLNELSVSY